MKKLFLFLNLSVILFLGGIGEAFANKKYRYIKREHGVRFQGNIPMTVVPGFNLQANLAGAYAYNWKGMVEVGPYFDLSASVNQGFTFNSWAVGLLVEYNFIKNRGKRSFIPALGLTAGINNSKENISPGMHLALGVHASLKSFVAKRTAFISTVGYQLHTPFNAFFRSMSHNAEVSMGFSYYFDFY